MGTLSMCMASKLWSVTLPKKQRGCFWLGLLSLTRAGKPRDWSADLELGTEEEPLENVLDVICSYSTPSG